MTEKLKISIKNLNVFYANKQALYDINLNIMEREVTSLIGPSGCGKSTLLKCLNRMNDLIDICSINGQIMIDGTNINDSNQDPVLLRSKVGMVFQKPNPFPKSIYDNVAYGPKLHGIVQSKDELDSIVIKSLSRAGLYEEVKNRLFERALAVGPEIILMDEPCSALDPIATAKIEELIEELKTKYTIVIVTHSMQQAARVSDRTAYMHMGELVESGFTKNIFSNPQHQKTQDYITGRIG